jgi:hypothetical protein
MLFSDVAHRNLFAFAVGDCDTEDALPQEDSLGVVSKSAMPEIRNESFRLIKPVVDRQVVLSFAAESSGTAFSVLHWVGHS